LHIAAAHCCKKVLHNLDMVITHTFSFAFVLRYF
jgi:hypothetical protein